MSWLSNTAETVGQEFERLTEGVAMKGILSASILAVVFVVPAFASNPGEPLDCSDWVFVEPGINCQVALDPCPAGSDQLCGRGASLAIDNRNRFIFVRESGGGGAPCYPGDSGRVKNARVP